MLIGFVFEIISASQFFISYRLAPENKHPLPMMDCWVATEYILNNPHDFDIDIDRVILAGDSAGESLERLIRN
jgi:acetyl esterase/lipase